LTNLDAVSKFLTRTSLIRQCTNTIKKIWLNTATSLRGVFKKTVYRQRRTFNKSFPKGKTSLQVNCYKNTRTETGVIVD